jgi:dTDP-4-dehydrorhamnose 3,5-epimerase-like enzyme
MNAASEVPMPQAELPTGCSLIPLTIRGDDRGSLIAIEQRREVPFEIARVYFIFGTGANVVRGCHSHLRLTQLAVAVAGSCTMLVDDGNERVSLVLDDPARALLLGPNVWREMSDFSPDCVLMVLADAPYDQTDYISDYDAFLSHVGSQRV